MKNVSKVRLSLCAQEPSTIYKKQQESYAVISAFSSRILPSTLSYGMA